MSLIIVFKLFLFTTSSEQYSEDYKFDVMSDVTFVLIDFLLLTQTSEIYDISIYFFKLNFSLIVYILLPTLIYVIFMNASPSFLENIEETVISIGFCV
jgi:cytochrome c oxidase subunit IV